MTALHRSLDGNGPQPLELYLSRLCAAFPGRLPSEVLAERDQVPEGLLEAVVEARAYESAYWVYRSNPKAGGELVERVKEIEFDLASEEIAARG